MQAALRPYATAGIALVGASLVAVTPLAAPLHNLRTVHDVSLTAANALTDVLSGAAQNVSQLINSEFIAPFAGLQQEIVDLTNILQSGSVADGLETNLQDILAGITLIQPSGMSDSAFGDVVSAVTPHTLNDILDISHLGDHELIIGHTLLFSQASDFLPSLSPALLDFLASPLSGELIGTVGPFIAPFVALANAIEAHDSFTQILAAPLNGFLNGADLNLDSLIPLIEQQGLLPDGTTLNSLDLALGGLFSAGEVGTPYTYYDKAGDAVGSPVDPVGGSIFNSLGLNVTLQDGITSPIHLPGPLTIDVPSAPVSMFGADIGMSQALAQVLGAGWDGKNGAPIPPLTQLDLGDLFSDDGGASTSATDSIDPLGWLGI